MNNKIIFLCLVILIILSGCTATEKIGDYRYKIKMERANTGDYGGMIVTIKSYYLKNELQGGCIIKSQLLYHENKTDTVFSTGFTTIDHINKELRCYVFNFYWYKDHIDDTYRSFIQEKDGKLKLKELKTIRIENENSSLWKEKQLNQ